MRWLAADINSHIEKDNQESQGRWSFYLPFLFYRKTNILVIRKTITESQLRQIVKESIRKVLRESNDFDEFDVDKDGQPILKGSKVIWFDPERSARDLKRIWTVYDMGGDIVCIADDYGEAEVFPQELKVMR